MIAKERLWRCKLCLPPALPACFIRPKMRNKQIRPKRLKLNSIRPTEDQYQARIDLCVTLLGGRYHKSQIKEAVRQFVKQQMGAAYDERTLTARSVEEYLARARRQMADTCTQKLVENTENATAFYENVIRSDKASWREKIEAQKQLDLIQGLHAPKRTEITGGGGAPLVPTTSPEVARALEVVYGVGREKVAAGQNGENGRHPG